MKKLKLPILKKVPERDKWLSMDDYIEFLNFNARNFGKSKTEKNRNDTHVRIPFSIK